MAMKKIKPQYGKVVPPKITTEETDEASEPQQKEHIETAPNLVTDIEEQKVTIANKKEKLEQILSSDRNTVKSVPAPNPFLQNKENFAKAQLTKIGYRMRTDYVELLDIAKKMKRNGYTLEAVLDDALTFYFENSEDGREAVRKAELFYS